MCSNDNIYNITSSVKRSFLWPEGFVALAFIVRLLVKLIFCSLHKRILKFWEFPNIKFHSLHSKMMSTGAIMLPSRPSFRFPVRIKQWNATGSRKFYFNLWANPSILTSRRSSRKHWKFPYIEYPKIKYLMASVTSRLVFPPLFHPFIHARRLCCWGFSRQRDMVLFWSAEVFLLIFWHLCNWND